MSGRLRRTVQLLLHLEDTPHRTALAFGIGLWLAFFPILGIHTGIALLFAFLCRLNRAAILVGVYFSNPWTVAPLYIAGTMLGCAVLGVPTEGLESIDWDLHGAQFYRALAASLRPYLWPFILGNTVLGIIAGLVGYVALRFVLERKRAPQTGSAT
ncbi:MAG: hypothetical protein DMF81_18670 [Acidobacteria bacterium]|nr:MAG: hypothetical protein DMF81_18670 [Acidobacteriota bacterium]